MKKYLFFAFFAALVISFVRFYIKTEREIQEILDELEREEARAREEETAGKAREEEKKQDEAPAQEPEAKAEEEKKAEPKDGKKSK